MELLVQSTAVGASSEMLDVAPPFTARYRPLLWEPIQGTSERLVALVAVQAHESTAEAIAPATYPVISEQRLRQLLGRQRGTSAAGILRECASFITQRQQAGLPIEEVQPLFKGFDVGPVMVARAWSVDQLLDAAVRSVSAFGSADEMIEEEEGRQSPRHTIRTREFLTQLRRIFVGNDKTYAARFDVPLRVRDVPDVVIDYAHGPLAVQVTSLPVTPRQAEHAEREAQAKLFQLDVARNQMGTNAFRPTMLFNTDALGESSGTEAKRLAERTRERLCAFARYGRIDVIEAANPSMAARLLDARALDRT